MEEPGTVKELVALIEMRWSHWARLLRGVGHERMAEPILDGGWSVRDTVAHIASYEGTLIPFLDPGALWPDPGMPEDVQGQDLDTRNAWLRGHHADRPLDEVLEEGRATHWRVVELVMGLQDEHLGRKQDETAPPLWQVVAGETYLHYPEHTEALRRALGR